MNPLIEQVKTEIAYRGYSQRTCKSYCEHLLKLSHYFNKPLDSITDDELNTFLMIRLFVNSLEQAKKYK
ncbi:phage integrase N-terminal SAM-like domain-containing protein [Pseudoalteromonas sp. XMcav11-Q]|uniref:phage integrase N-terminal SAM-like domain-containing protein n=1 Tax=Pseudoalteromonas sp. XMcav11-Q TaxID=3136665 RepID=UPI0032C3D813